MISAVGWVPRGGALEQPLVFQPTEEELKKMAEKAEEEEIGEEEGDAAELDEDENGEEKMEDEHEAAQTAEAEAIAKARRAQKANENDELAIYNLDKYDDSEDDGLPGVGHMAYDKDVLVDANIVAPDEDEEEDEDFRIRSTDNLILVGKTEEEMSTLEIYVYDDDSASLYVHHEILLPAFPLALAWSPVHPKEDKRGNIVAVGTFRPEIELWDIDVVDAMEPAVTLGGEVEAPKGSKKKGKKGKKKATSLFNWKEGSHKNSVLSLSWNPTSLHHLASGSADEKVKVWDVSREACVATLAHHTDKVQAVEWSTEESYVLLTGGFDQKVHLADARQGDQASTVHWSVPEPIECLHWDPCHPPAFAVSTEKGNVFFFDARKPGEDPFLRIQAHDKACPSFSFQRHIPGMVVTASTDASVKVWDVSVAEGKASLVDGKAMELGSIFNVSASPDLPFVVAAGGSDDLVGVWDMSEKESIVKCFKGRLPQN